MARRGRGLQASNSRESTFPMITTGAWMFHTSLKKAQQRPFFFSEDLTWLLNFYHCTTEATFTYCWTVWYSSWSTPDRKNLQQLIKTVQWIIRSPRPKTEDIHSARLQRHPTDPGHSLFFLLPSGRPKTSWARTDGRKNRFFPQAVDSLFKVKPI